MQETEMVNHAQNGNLIAFGELMEHHHRTVEKYAFQCGVQVVDIRSVTIEVFIKLYKSLGEFQSSDFTTRLYKLTLKATRDYHKREKQGEEEQEYQRDEHSTRLPQSRILVFNEDRELMILFNY